MNCCQRSLLSNLIKPIRAFLIFCFILTVDQTIFAQTSAEFFAPRAYDGGIGFAVADLDGDGRLDVVSAKADSLTLLKGDGSGSFPGPPQTVYTCTRFSSNAFRQPMAGDFTGDGKPDIAAWMEDNTCAGRGSRSLMVIPGNGAGGFQAPVFTDVSNFFFTPEQSVAGDFNNDSKLDIVVSTGYFGDSNLGVFPGNGNGSFAAPLTAYVSGLPYEPLLVGDFNGDNRPDLAFAPITQYNVKVLPNNGNGTFGAAQSTETGIFARKTASGDFNNDGKPDMAIVRDRDFETTIQLWLGSGNGTFQSGSNLTLTGTSGFVNSLASADLNNDGNLDLILSLGNRTIVFRGNGSGALTEDARYGAGGGKLFKGDFNNDGWTDVAATQTLGLQGSQLGLSTEFGVMLNLRNGTLLSAPEVEIPFGGDELAFADFNNDGLKDIALTGDAQRGEIVIFLQQPGPLRDKKSNRAFERVSADIAAAGGGAVSPRTIATGDFNGDGKTDVVVAGRAAADGSPNVIVARNDGSGSLTLMTTLSLAGTVTKVISADFNGDNILDLAFSQNRETSPSPSPAVSVAFGNGNGTFAAPGAYLNANQVGTGLASADFNGDSRLDLAVSYYNNQTAILLNNGNGGFATGPVYDLSLTPTEIVAAELHGDGYADLIIAQSAGATFGFSRISVLSGNGSGSFSPPVEYLTIALYNQRLTVDDFNGDGRRDVAVANNGVITVLENNGSGNLNKRRFWASAGALLDIASTDFDGDTKVDLVTTSFINGYASLGFLPNITEPGSGRAAPFDFDGDGRTDISIFRPSAGEWWYLRSSEGNNAAAQFGASTDKTVPGDFTGDGITDIAFWRPSEGLWFILRSEDGSFFSFPFGAAGDIPAPSDYDGDGKADAAVYRPSSGTWFIQNSSGAGTSIVNFGTSEDTPVPADFDGDGKTDIAIFRPSDGSWWYVRSSDRQFRVLRFGVGTDKPVPGDYTGDGKSDIAVFRPASGEWFIKRSEDDSYFSLPFGTPGDVAVAGDYDGDGRFDTAVFRPSNSTWYIQRSTAGILIAGFGTTGDRPVPGTFVP